MNIRTVSLCVIRRRDEFLLEETFDQVTNKTYYRPVGGTVEIGENSKHTVIREVKEEINADITDPKLLGVIENIFTYQDQIGHEIDFIYEAELMDSKLYNNEKIKGIEGTTPYNAVWKPLKFFNNNNVKLVPEGLSTLLDEYDNTTNIKHVITR